jgi:hypothetical protein
MRVGIVDWALQHDESQRVRRNGWVPAHRGTAALARRLLVGATEESGVVQLPVWAAGIPCSGA